MDLHELMAPDDVVRTTSLVSRGATRHSIAKAVKAGTVQRVRRGWLAGPKADPLLVSAATQGVVLTCVTQAARLGLWDVHPSVPHVAAPRHAGRIAVAAHVHWERPPLARHPDALADPIENTLAIVARCQPHDFALAVWNSALRAGAVDLDVLRRLPLSPAAHALIEEAEPFADSGLESIMVPRLRWLNLPLRRQIWIAGHRVDLLIGERLIVQIDGGHHVGAQRTSDIEHDAQLMLMGYHVIRVGYEQVMHRWADVQDLIMRAVAMGLHLRR
ncbi:DUF559 domain-containing protein [Microbacterium sp. ZW T5_45]|uniref:DUF559 domain-containing protein n=1 Tax=Microbacterium sp. ZW T5_45 TaxID=3378080 RepID=UPI003854B99D